MIRTVVGGYSENKATHSLICRWWAEYVDYKARVDVSKDRMNFGKKE